MRILVTNDDGLTEPGLAALRTAALEFGDVTVVAPATHQSGASHSITLDDLRASRQHVYRPDGFEGIAVDGRPADCVRLAVLGILDEPPDLVLSGINAGANVGIHVLYSGTVAAAAEAVMLSIPAVAFSLSLTDQSPDFRRAGKLCQNVLGQLIKQGLKAGDLINVNLPSSSRPKGVKIVRQGLARLNDQYRRRPSADGEIYQLHGGGFRSAQRDTDISALAGDYVTLTPLHVDMTDHDSLGRWADDNWDGLCK